MKTWKLFVLCIVVSMMAVSVVSAKEDSSMVPVKEVSPASQPININYIDNLISISASDGHGLKQGQTDTRKINIGKKVKSITIECDWGNPKNSLTLTIIAPDGKKYGPYSDSYDGKIDGCTGVKLTKKTGAWDATPWTIKVYGKKVSGTETFGVFGTWVVA
ncbi:hypothetical protein ASJ81_04630 [Methanosarcina spelaei]|uniref:Uncharacterized protein n=1 Tax=Methanosarcina spelaei TaxID=1036679 RepID=A0A2A2HUU6_9EURY|nr:hypothetical protein ASJ81_04630 [Methanosarcina spelaei]